MHGLRNLLKSLQVTPAIKRDIAHILCVVNTLLNKKADFFFFFSQFNPKFRIEFLGFTGALSHGFNATLGKFSKYPHA